MSVLSGGILSNFISGGVSSFNGRTGAVTPQAGDYAAFYVPYTGATANVNLGTHSLSSNTLAITAGATFAGDLFDINGTDGTTSLFTSEVVISPGTFGSGQMTFGGPNPASCSVFIDGDLGDIYLNSGLRDNIDGGSLSISVANRKLIDGSGSLPAALDWGSGTLNCTNMLIGNINSGGTNNVNIGFDIVGGETGMTDGLTGGFIAVIFGNLYQYGNGGLIINPSTFDTTLNGKITTYAGETTADGGVPAIRAVTHLNNKTAAIGSTTIFTPSNTGTYRVSYTATITRAASTSSVLGGTNGFRVSYTGALDSVVKTTVAANSVTSTANTTGTAVTGSFLIYALNSAAVNFTFDYTSVGVTAMQYEITVTFEALTSP